VEFEAGRNALRLEDRQRFQNIFVDQATRSYILLSFGIGGVAFLLPIVLMIAGGYAGHWSISSFYYVPETPRNILVGSLWATSVFLFLFHGLSDLENWILNIAGVAGISVAMNPMGSQQCAGGGVSLHSASAILFFLCLAFVAIALSKGRIRYIVDPTVRKRFKRAYNAAGAMMVAMPAAVAAIHFIGKKGCESHHIFWIETFGIWAFAAFWFVKTFQYRLLLGVRWRAPMQ
jgi:hypothetical protein